MTYVILLVLIVVGALLAVVSGVRAVRAWLSYRRVRGEFQGHLASEVDDLARKTAEIEQSLASLEVRTQQLPIRISELQQSLSNLSILTEALAATLRQSQQILSYTALKTFSSSRLSSTVSGTRRSGRGN